MPTYNANIPQPTDQLSQSQSDLLNNFQSISALINVNHVDFNTGDQGKHKWVTFPNQVSVPTPPFNANELSLYNFINPTTMANELYVQKGTAAGIPMTASLKNANGWSYLPSGILIKWGFGNSPLSPTTNPFTFVFPVLSNTPVFSSLFTVLLAVENPAGTDSNWAIILQSAVATQFTAFATNRTTVGSYVPNLIFTYIAIGA